MNSKDLCAWLRENSSGAYRPSADAADRIELLESVVRALLADVVPHTRDTGHNAADREMSEAINAARAVVQL